MPTQIHINHKVDNKAIRRETYNDREHVVIPSYTLPANVIMNEEFYPEAEISANYRTLEGTLAPLGHPMVDGQFVSAFSPEGLNVGFIGAWNRNVSLHGNRVYAEKWIDVNKAMESPGGVELLQRIEAIEKGETTDPIWSSVAVFRERTPAPKDLQDQGAKWVVKIHAIDHDAILLHELPAAGPEKGVGLMVNADLATPLKANSGTLVGESYREREQRLDRAAKARFAPGENEYAWVADFTDSQVVIIRNGGNAQVFGYMSEGGKITFDDTGTPVARQESWVTVVANKVKSLFTPQEPPATNHQTEGDMPLTNEEKQELITEIGKGLAANFADALKPVTEQIQQLQTNQQQLNETLTANSRAEEQTMRDAVQAVHGELVANALSGPALKEMFSKLGTAAPLAGNSARTPGETGAPDPSTYFPD